MAYSNSTGNYGLPLYVGSDKPSWLDTNEPFQRLDSALGTATGHIERLEGQMVTVQNKQAEDESLINQNALNIAEHGQRLTATEAVASNALTSVAQLSEKVYNYEERTFTTGADFMAVYSNLTLLEKFSIIITSITFGSWETYTTTITPSGVTCDATTTPGGIHRWVMRLASDSATPAFTGTYDENGISQVFHTDFRVTVLNDNFVGHVMFYGQAKNASDGAFIKASNQFIISQITALIPVAVADD